MKKGAIILLHTGYWLCYIMVFYVIGVFLQAATVFRGASAFFFLAVFVFIPGIIGFYLFYELLFSKFLKKKRIGYLVVWSLLIAAIIGVSSWFLLNAFWKHIGPANKVSLDYGGSSEAISLIIASSINVLLNGVVAMVMRGFINWYADIKLKEELNKKNYEMEIALVKSQLNPHFLFNTINNIDVLIEKDPVKASDYLNKLSDMLRFMLYESKPVKVPLSKELSYIDKYIALQRIRTANPDRILYTVKGVPGTSTTAPMLFIPFIENAFKHADNTKAGNAISIAIAIENDMLYFNCENMYNLTPIAPSVNGGLGNHLIQKRLDLLYPKKHQLKIENKNGQYKVSLTINLHED